MSFKMHRYLEKYIGTYRVKAHYDLDTEDFPRDENNCIDEEYDEQYIPTTRKGEIRATYRNTRGKDFLCWYCPSGEAGRNVAKAIREKYPEVKIEIDDCGTFDYFIYFDAEDIEKIADIVKPSTFGAKIRPYSVKNLPKIVYTIPEADLKQYLDILSIEMEPYQKMHLVLVLNKEFREVVQKKTKQDINNKMKFKEYVHSVGMWNEYIEFLKGKLQKEK